MFINYAHRGASHYAPQNTLSAFYLGLQMGANGIETDVQMTRDGVLVLYHDRELDPAARLGYLTDQYDEDTLAFAHAIGAEQLCLKSDAVTPDSVALIHGEGFGVRAWSIRSEADMLKVIDAGVDGGMTIDFPDMLTAYCEAHPEVQAR